jgi:hypothetical protein
VRGKHGVSEYIFRGDFTGDIFWGICAGFFALRRAGSPYIFPWIFSGISLDILEVLSPSSWILHALLTCICLHIDNARGSVYMVGVYKHEYVYVYGIWCERNRRAPASRGPAETQCARGVQAGGASDRRGDNSISAIVVDVCLPGSGVRGGKLPWVSAERTSARGAVHGEDGPSCLRVLRVSESRVSG